MRAWVRLPIEIVGTLGQRGEGRSRTAPTCERF
jgi:hypothetical protein